MHELKTKYKVLIFGLSLLAVLPLFIAASNHERLTTFIEETYMIQAAAEHYNINIHECIKCQENGWLFATILIAFLIFTIVVTFTLALIPIAIIMKLLAGWHIRFTINALLLGRYPDTWKVTNT